MSIKEWWSRQRTESKRRELTTQYMWQFNFPLRQLGIPPNNVLWVLNPSITIDWYIVGCLKDSLIKLFHTYEESKNFYLDLRNKSIEEGAALLEDYIACPQVEVPSYGFPVLFRETCRIVPEIQSQFQAKYCLTPAFLESMGITQEEILTPIGNPKEYTKMWWLKHRYIKRVDIDEVPPYYADSH